jgi:hypothetical protein
VFVKSLPSSPRAFSLLGVILCVVAWAGEITAGAHETGVRHVRCVEHGEVTHQARRGAAPTIALAEGLASDRDVASGDSGPAGFGHDHCALALLLGQGASPLRPSSGLAPCIADSGARMCTAWAGAGPISGDRLLALAPKTSPPQLSSRA